MIVTLLSLGVATSPAAADIDLELVRTLRLRGDLEVAKELLVAATNKTDIPPDGRIERHLEMARVLDRIGLHRNTRPVVEALAHIDLAATLLGSASEHNRAAVQLAYADYYYRAEMGERVFSKAEEHARRAIALYAEIGDGYGQADAAHRLGLIEFQRGNLDSAETLFDESLDFDIAAGERPFFRGEYERHVGYVVYRRGDVESAARHFERSLQARRDAGAIDASLFAAISLANVLIELGRRDEAQPKLDYALDIAQRIESPVALERIKAAADKLAATPTTSDANIDKQVSATHLNAMPWTELPDGRAIATMHGNRQTGEHITLVRFPAGMRTAIHTHSNSYDGTIVQGLARHYEPKYGEPGQWLAAGSVYRVPAGVAHISECSGSSACIFAIHQHGPFDRAIVE